jgi:hypothetical protein
MHAPRLAPAPAPPARRHGTLSVPRVPYTVLRTASRSQRLATHTSQPRPSTPVIATASRAGSWPLNHARHARPDARGRTGIGFRARSAVSTHLPPLPPHHRPTSRSGGTAPARPALARPRIGSPHRRYDRHHRSAAARRGDLVTAWISPSVAPCYNPVAACRSNDTHPASPGSLASACTPDVTRDPTHALSRSPTRLLPTLRRSPRRDRARPHRAPAPPHATRLTRTRLPGSVAAPADERRPTQADTDPRVGQPGLTLRNPAPVASAGRCRPRWTVSHAPRRLIPHTTEGTDNRLLAAFDRVRHPARDKRSHYARSPAHTAPPHSSTPLLVQLTL